MLSILEFVNSASPTKADTLYKDQNCSADFVFDSRVVDVFPDMIGRSVPGYWMGAEWIGMLSKRFVEPDGRVYDLGCSLGAISWGIFRHWGENCPQIIAVDSSKPMLFQFQKNLNTIPETPPFTLVHEDIRHTQIQDASMVILNFTLQFIPPEERLLILSRIYKGLKPGGVLVLSEKRYGQSPDEERHLRDWHHDFKRNAGYSQNEIQQKSDAIANIMPLDTPNQQKNRLLEAGFKNQTQWFQCFNFSSVIAEK